MGNGKMDKQKAVEVLKNRIHGECDSEELIEAMKIAVEAMQETNCNTKKVKNRTCQYLQHGLCTGQKGMPQCTPNYGYCPKQKEA